MRKGRIIGGLAAALVAGLATVPLVIASVTESRFEHIRRAAVEKSPLIQSWTVTRYDRGYLGSEATSRITVGAPNSEDTFTLDLDHRIRHAPATGTDLATVHTRPSMDAPSIRELAQALYADARPPFTVDVRIGFTGERTIHARSPATDGMRRVNNARVDWRGLEAMLTLGADADRLAYHLEAPGLEMEPIDGEADAARVQLESLRAKGRYEATEFEQVWTGGASGRIERMAFETPDDTTFSLRTLTFADEARLRDGLFGFTVEAAAEALDTPRYALTSLNMTISGERIAPALLQSLQRAADQAAPNGAGSAEPEAFTNSLGQAPWAEIAAEKPLLQLRSLRADTPDGAVSLSATAGLHAPGEGRERVAPGELLGLAHGEVDARAPRDLVVETIARSIALSADIDPAEARASARQTLEGLIAQGLVNAGNGGVHSSASYDRGGILINGRSLFGG